MRGALRTRTAIGIAIVIALAIAATAALWLGGPADAPLRADAGDDRQVARGGIVYRDYCASCHGADLEGQPDWRRRKADGRLPAPPHDATGHTWHHPDAQLFELTKRGVAPPLAPEGYESDMPGFAAALSDADIWAVLAYIKSRWPDEIRARQEALNRRTP